MEAVIVFSILIVTIGLSIPIGITLGLSTGIAMWLTSDIPMVMLAQKSVTGLDSLPSQRSSIERLPPYHFSFSRGR